MWGISTGQSAFSSFIFSHSKRFLFVSPVAGHPKVQKSAIFDIITPDLAFGPIASGAELIAVANDCLNSFPNLSSNYDIHISHSKRECLEMTSCLQSLMNWDVFLVIEVVLTRLPSGHRDAVVDIMSQSKSSLSQKRALLLKRGLLRSTADELEVLAEIGVLSASPPCAKQPDGRFIIDEDIEGLIYRLEKLSPALVNLIQPFVNELKQTVDYARSTKVTRSILFHPLMLGNHNDHFKDGVLIQVVRKNKRSDVLAAGGRYVFLSCLVYGIRRVEWDIPSTATTTSLAGTSHSNRRLSLSVRCACRLLWRRSLLRLPRFKAPPSRLW